MSVVLEPLAVERLMPLGDRIIIERFEGEEKTQGGIFIPDTAKEKPAKGIVVAVGPGKRLESGEIQALSIKVGDKVLFGKYAGTEVKLGDKEYIVMREEDVMAIITE